MITRVRPVAFAAGLLLAAGFAAPAAADDPPWRVARVSYLSGSVSFRPANADDWDLARLNYPLNAGDQLWTDSESRAELHVGSTAIRLAPQTAFSFLNMDDRFVQMQVNEGTVEVRVRQVFDDDRYEVDTPNAAVRLMEPGVYRVDVTSDGTRSRVTVRYGRADVNSSQSAFAVRQGESAELVGADNAEYNVDAAIPIDAWERWCSDRDRREDYATSARYVSREMIGYEDLDDYGYWSSVPDYGWVWRPTHIAIGWAPYRYGHWRHVGYWGWTWIDDAPWGFATCHYGRWAWYDSSWMWVPGRMMPRPYYAPALVAFVGGSGWRVGFSFGSSPLGWFPLAPGEPWWPSYRATPGYIRNVNVAYVNVNNYNFTNINVNNFRYANLGIDRAVTAVPRDAFVSARSARVTGVAVPRSELGTARVLGMAAPVAPLTTRPVNEARRAGIAVPRPSNEVMNRGAVVRSAPSGGAVTSGSDVPLGNREGAPASDGRARQRFDNRAPAPEARPGAVSRDPRGQVTTPGGGRDPSQWRPAARPGEVQPRESVPRSPSAVPRGGREMDAGRPAAVTPRGAAPPSGTPSWRPPTRQIERAPEAVRPPTESARPPAGVARPPAVVPRGGDAGRPQANWNRRPTESVRPSYESARPPVEFRRPAEPARPSDAGRPPVEFRRAPEVMRRAPEVMRPPVEAARPPAESFRRAPEMARPSAPQPQRYNPPVAAPRQPGAGAPAPQQSAPRGGNSQARPRHPGGEG